MEKEFTIKLITRRSHWFDEFAIFLFLLAFIALFIFYASMVPSKDSSVELQTLWFIEGVPLWVKKLALWGLILLGITIIFELINRRIKKGIIKVKQNSIEISTRKKSIQFLFDEIKEIAFVSPMESRKYKIFFKLKEDKIVTIKLSDYSELDDLTDSFSPLADKDIKIRTGIEDPYWLE